ncbi:MAG: hypothetical protein HP493_14400 [Nitrospira sp.]|nr:hypothetical protein [Nitrospira sp.]
MAIAAIVARVHHAFDQLGTDCSMEEVVHLCPELSWNQVFLAIDDLSRSGLIRLMLDGDRAYRVQVHQAVMVAASLTAPAS